MCVRKRSTGLLLDGGTSPGEGWGVGCRSGFDTPTSGSPSNTLVFALGGRGEGGSRTPEASGLAVSLVLPFPSPKPIMWHNTNLW